MNTKMKMKSTMVRMTAAMLCVLCGFVSSASAADRTWTGAGTNGHWSNTNNWVGGVVAGDWDGVIFDANTVNGVVSHNAAGGRGRIVLTSGLTQDVILRYSSTEFIQSNTGFTITEDSRDLVLSLYGKFMRIWGTANLWSVGSGRTLTANCLLYEGLVDKRGAGTAILARAIIDNRVNIAVNEGTAKTVIDQAGSLNKWTVASGATWEFGSQNQAIYGLWGNGTVKSPAGDTVFMGPVTSVNGELISTNRNYVYKLDFGTGGGATVNGVVFDAAGTSGAGWVLSGTGSTYGESVGSSGFAQFISDFYYNGATSTLAFTNLTVGTRYEAVIYSAPSWNSRIQDATFSNGTDVVTLRDTDPQYTGYYVYRFTANTKLASITMSGDASRTYHWYGATLEDLTGVASSSRSATLTVGDGNNHSFSGVISGDIALVKQGSGVQSLSGNNTYSGATVISNGTLRLHASLVTPVDATALSAITASGRTATRTIDGSGMTPNNPVAYASTAGNTPDNAMWLSSSKLTWITFDLGSVQTLSGFRLWNQNQLSFTTRGIKDAGVYTGSSLPANGASYASMGAAWGTLVTNMTFAQANGTTTGAGSDYMFAAPVTTRYLQFYVTDNWGDPGYTGLSEIRFFSGATTTNVLPAATALTIASGGVLDIVSVSQDVATLSGSGAVINGTLGVTSALYPGGAGVEGALTLQGLTLGEGASLYWDYSAGGADLVSVLGTANLPATATVRVSATDPLPERVTLMQCGAINAPSGVSGWTVEGAHGNSRVVIQGNEVQLLTLKGTVILVL